MKILQISGSVNSLVVRKDIAHSMRKSEVFVLPSQWKGLPIVILGAMASGMPVITTRVGGIPEVIESGKDGIFVEPENPEELSNAILRLLDDDKPRSLISSNDDTALVASVIEVLNILQAARRSWRHAACQLVQFSFSLESPTFRRVRPTGLLFRNFLSTPMMMVRRGAQQWFSPAEHRCENYLLWLRLAFSGSHVGYLLPSLTYLHKAPYGVSGLNVDLSAIKGSELQFLRRERKESLVGVPLWILATLFSRVKYLKRLVHVLARGRLSSW